MKRERVLLRRAMSWRTLRDQRGFSLTELVMVIVILGILAAVALPMYVNMTKEAERAAVEHTLGNFSSALSIWTMKQISSGLPVTAHNPVNDLSAKLDNYAGAFPDVDLTNCKPGQWAYQTGNAANNNWPVLVYRPKSSLATAFGWSSNQWLVFEIKSTTNAQGQVVGLGVVEYPPLHVW